MNISLPPTLKDFVDHQVQRGEYASSSEYVRELIRRELRDLLLAGVTSEPAAPAGPEYFESLRGRVRNASTSAKRR